MRSFLLRLSPIVIAAVAGLAIWGGFFARASVNVRWRPEKHPQTSWAACNRNAGRPVASTFKPLSDAAAAALVSPEPETRPDNGKAYVVNGVRHVAPNDYVPTNAELAAFRSAKDSLGEPILHLNPYLKYVDGRDGLHSPTTDELIQWGAHKWGIPENWLRAEYVLESYWNMWMRGDEATVTPALYAKYPPEARVPGSLSVYQSLGITQVRWDPQGDFGAEAIRCAGSPPRSTSTNRRRWCASSMTTRTGPAAPGAIKPTCLVSSGTASEDGSHPTRGLTPARLIT